MRHRLLILLTAAVAMSVTTARAFDVPKRKSGLWEMTTTRTNSRMGAHTMQMCVDEKTDNLMRDRYSGRAQEACTKNDIRQDGDRIVFDSICTVNNTRTTTHGVLSGKFDSAYRMESNSTYEPPLMGMKDASTSIDAKWVGPCKPGQKPGDVVMPGMGTMNLQEMMKQIPQK